MRKTQHLILYVLVFIGVKNVFSNSMIGLKCVFLFLKMEFCFKMLFSR